jgi:hypothetical protein
MSRTVFENTLLERSQPPSAMDVLDELASRLESEGGSVYPPGVLVFAGQVLRSVLNEVEYVKATKQAAKQAAKDVANLTVEK